MTLPPAIIDFDFASQNYTSDQLIEVWMPEIEAVAATHVPDDRFVSFLVAAMRLIARSKSLKGFNLMDLVQKAGYSRSTFFRLFEGYTGFLLKGYQMTCLLSVKVYKKYLSEQELDLDDFCKYTADVFFGANCTIPNEIIQMLYKENNLAHKEFHPHLPEIASIIEEYFSQNQKTQNYKVDQQELVGVLTSLDLVILNARLDDDPLWGTSFYYNKLKKILKGYFLASQ
ncbi:hypothetical protein E7681_18380 [Thalassobius vesicularis]|uniref:Uncharacterized protein n=1 Tax=Thalassobius vesicularis TaxID=1294297 RepID=A0A4S3M5F8_9RHOB|nr:hypothetical protein [Thalassobius vesicularis]THD71181.1 hypothetical protein E7681_18380 [Thalassobius vesicularis]